MNILINASEIKQGGGIQVTDSICRTLNDYPNHQFFVVLSSYFYYSDGIYKNTENVRYIEYNLNKFNAKLLVTGRDEFLDKIVEDNKIEIVLSVFGPSLWNPRCKKVTGFARAHLVMPESPYYATFSKIQLFKENVYNKLLYYYFKRSTDVFFTENEMITNRVEKLFKKKAVTITNYYNQVFDNKDSWIERTLPKYDGITLLTISSYYPHKNLTIAFDILNYIKEKGEDIRLCFVYTVSESDFPPIPECYKDNFLLIGKIDIRECPRLYEQCDIAFQPTLLECFTATYPEAMRMKKPIITTDMEFAKGLCGDAACYYSAVDGKSAAEAILKVIKDKDYAQQLVHNGEKQLLKYDTYKQRSEKLIKLLEETVINN